MRLPRLRLRIWVLMALVAVVAVVMGAERCRRRWVFFRQQATVHAGLARQYEAQAGIEDNAVSSYRKINESQKRSLEAVRRKGYGEAILRQEEKLIASSATLVDMVERRARRLRILTIYHSDLERKYEHAARYPWLPVEPDPPEPE